MPELRRAASAEQLQSMRKRTRALATCYALGALALALGMIALVGLVVHGIWRNPDKVDVPSDALGLAIPLVFGLVGSLWLWIRVEELWERHSPIKPRLLSAINDIRDGYYIKKYSETIENVERYRSEVILMGREFTPYDLNVLESYGDRVADYHWDLDAWVREQSERRRLYGDATEADAATQAVIGRLRKG